MTTLKMIKQQTEKITPAKARILARLKADGSISKIGTDYKISYEVKDVEQLKSFEQDIKNVYGLGMKWLTNRSGITGLPIPLVRVRSKLALEDLLKFGKFRSKNWTVPTQILNARKDIQKEFIRAFYDDEGSVIVKRHEIRLYSINKKGLEQIKDMLKKFNIKTKIVGGYGKRRNVHSLTINKIKDIKIFKEEIEFGLKRKQGKLLKILSTKAKDEHD